MKKIFSLCLMLVMAVCGCSTQVAPYDAAIENSVVSLQKENTQLFLDIQHKNGTPAGAFTGFQKQYDEMEVNIQSLKLRAGATPNDSITAEQVDLLEADFQLLQKAHQGGVKPAEVAPMEDAMNRIYGAILKFELTKKAATATSKSTAKTATKSKTEKTEK